MAHSGGRLGGEGRGYLQGRRALPRGRPRPALQLCPAWKRRPSARPGPGLASAPPPHRGRQSPTSSPFSPLDPARPGRPCRAEGRGQGSEPPHPWRAPPKGEGRRQLPWHGRASPTQGPAGEALSRELPAAQFQGPLWGSALTGSPLGPFSPGAPLRPASPCGRFGADVRPNPPQTLPCCRPPAAHLPSHHRVLAPRPCRPCPACPGDRGRGQYEAGGRPPSPLCHHPPGSSLPRLPERVSRLSGHWRPLAACAPSDHAGEGVSVRPDSHRAPVGPRSALRLGRPNRGHSPVLGGGRRPEFPSFSTLTLHRGDTRARPPGEGPRGSGLSMGTQQGQAARAHRS